MYKNAAAISVSAGRSKTLNVCSTRTCNCHVLTSRTLLTKNVQGEKQITACINCNNSQDHC